MFFYEIYRKFLQNPLKGMWGENLYHLFSISQPADTSIYILVYLLFYDQHSDIQNNLIIPHRYNL